MVSVPEADNKWQEKNNGKNNYKDGDNVCNNNVNHTEKPWHTLGLYNCKITINKSATV